MTKQTKSEVVGNAFDKGVEEYMATRADYIERCVDHIYQFFHVNGYLWAGSAVPPSREEISTTIQSLVETLLRSDAEYCETGRLYASIDSDNILEIHIVL